jgi:ataxin-3
MFFWAGSLGFQSVAIELLNCAKFFLQVIQKALEVWDLQVIPLDSPVAEPAKIDPNLENAFIFHPHNHWFCVRKVNGEWYNFDSLNAAPRHLSKSSFVAFLDSLKGSRWSIFVVRGNFPEEFPFCLSESSNRFGKWLSPEDAERINKSCNSGQQAPQEHSNQLVSDEEDEMFLDMEDGDLEDAMEMLSDREDEDLEAAIAASLMDSAPAEAKAPHNDENNQVPSSSGGDKSQSENQNKENNP